MSGEFICDTPKMTRFIWHPTGFHPPIVLALLFFVLLTIAILSSVVAGQAAAGNSPQPFAMAQKLLASDRESNEEFGAVVVMSQDNRFMLVGAPAKHVDGYIRRGQIYIYERDGNNQWVEIQKLTAADGSHGDRFGSSIAIAHAPDYTIIVGAPSAEEGWAEQVGAAYVFAYNGSSWSQQTRLPIIEEDDELIQYDRRGTAVAITSDGSRVFVGAPPAGSGSPRPGAIYVLARSGNSWSQEEKIMGPMDNAAAIGQALLVTDNDTALLAAGWHYPSESFNERGIVRVYRRPNATWEEVAVLTPSDGLVDDHFGEALAVSHDAQTLLIGAPRHNRQAYVFTASGESWTEQAILTPPNSSPYGFFGNSVAMDATGQKMAVGAWYLGSGGIHLFEKSDSTWEHVQTLHRSNDDLERLGWAVAMSGSGDMIAGGATHADSNKPIIEDGGAVYVFMPGYLIHLPFVMK